MLNLESKIKNAGPGRVNVFILSLFYTGNADYGKDEDSAEALLKRHEAFIGDLEGFKNTIEGLKEQATNCRQQETPIVDITGI